MINEPKTLEEIQAERRRQRWGYFWTPFITMASIVSSIGMLMFLVKSCEEKNLPGFIVPPTSPLHRQGAAETPLREGDGRADEQGPPGTPLPDPTRDNPIDRKSPAP